MACLRGQGRRGGRWGLLCRAFLLAVSFGTALADEKTQRYTDGEEVNPKPQTLNAPVEDSLSPRL